MGNRAPSRKVTNSPIDERVTSTPNPRRHTTKLVSKDDYTTKVSSTPRATTPRQTTAITSTTATRNPTENTTRQSKVFMSSTKINNGFDDRAAMMSSGSILQKPTPAAKVAMDDAAITVIVTCLGGALLFLCLVITTLIILRRHSRGKSFRNGGSKKSALHTSTTNHTTCGNENTVLSVTSHFDSQEYTSIDEGCGKMHPTQTENFYDSVKIYIPESTQDVIYYEPPSNITDSKSHDTGQTCENEDDGLYLTPDVGLHEKKREQTDDEGRYSVIWPATEKS